MKDQNSNDDIERKVVEGLYRTVKDACIYLECSREELLRWIEPDGYMPSSARLLANARLWSIKTLQSAKPLVPQWRSADNARLEQYIKEQRERDLADKARRKGMRKNKALTASKACEALGCSLTELNRWAGDGRLPPDGEIVLQMSKTVYARAWLPQTIENAKVHLEEWRKIDLTRKMHKRCGLRAIK